MRPARPAPRNPLPALCASLPTLCASLLASPALADRFRPEPLLPPIPHVRIPDALRPPLALAPAEPVRDAFSAWAHRLDLSHIELAPAHPESALPPRVLATNAPFPMTLSRPGARALLDRLDDAWLLADEGLATSRWVLERLHTGAARDVARRAARLAHAVGSVAPLARVPAALAHRDPLSDRNVCPPAITVLPLALVRLAEAQGFPLLKPHADLAWAEIRRPVTPVRPAPTFSFLGMGPHGTLDAPPRHDAVAAE